MTANVNDARRPPPGLYGELAWLWPLWGDDADYASYCDQAAALVRRHARRPLRTLLDIGCGGGRMARQLRRDFEVTGLDISPAMLAQARIANPGCELVEADMRSFDLGRRFDAVLMDDAVSHMASRDELDAALRCARAHLAPGGVMVLTPDFTRETFVQNRTQVATGARDGVEVAFVENLHDPDPDDDQCQATLVYLIREQGRQRIETEQWTFGLFSLAQWHESLAAAGFEVHPASCEVAGESYAMFACVAPGGEGAPAGNGGRAAAAGGVAGG